MSLRLVIILTVAVAGFSLSACGGGGSPNSLTTTTQPRTALPAAGAQSLEVSVAPWRLPAPVSRAVVLTDGQNLLVFGGQDASHNSTATTSQIDPKTGTVTALGPLSPAVHDAAGVRVGQDDLIIAGGSPPPRAAVQTVQGAGPAQLRGQLPAARTDHVAALVGDSIYVFGGAQDEGFPVATVFSSADAGATWHDAGTLTQPVRYPAIAVIGTAAYLFGGVTTTNGTDTTAIQRYDPKTHTTSVIAQLPAPLSHASAITFGNVVFLLGGFVNNTPSTQVLRFDVSHQQDHRRRRAPRTTHRRGRDRRRRDRIPRGRRRTRPRHHRQRRDSQAPMIKEDRPGAGGQELVGPRAQAQELACTTVHHKGRPTAG